MGAQKTPFGPRGACILFFSILDDGKALVKWKAVHFFHALQAFPTSKPGGIQPYYSQKDTKRQGAIRHLMEYIITADHRFAPAWARLASGMNTADNVRAVAVEREAAPLELHLDVDPAVTGAACMPIAGFALGVVAPYIIASDFSTSPDIGLTSGLSPATVEAVARAGALRNARWRDIAAERIAESLSEQPTLRIEGFLRFRMRDMMDTLQNELHSLLGALNIEEEYRRFIELLKRYAAVNRKETEILTVYFAGDGGYALHTADGRRLLSVPPLLDGEESGDMLLTLLGSISPVRVAVVGSANVPEDVRNAIAGMFGSRARFDS